MVGVYYVILCICIFGLVNSAKNNGCPAVCLCLGSYVDCPNLKLESVPSDLPLWVTHLNLHNNSLKKLNESVWDNLVNLTEIKLNKNYVSVLPKDVFCHQKELRILELNRNQLKKINALTFQCLSHLTSLKLKKNQVEQLLDGAFYGLQVLDKLTLDFNKIQTISKGWLYGLNNLKELSLSHNSITRIEVGSWEFCPVLNDLDLSFNNLESIQTETFTNLRNVQKLNLNNNNINFIEENAFAPLTDLKTLFLNNNKISWTIEDANGAFQGLSNLLKFHIAGNDIKSINKNAFLGLNSLVHLNLLHNNISSVQEMAFNTMPLLKDLSLNTSTLVCDFNLRWFSKWLQAQQFNVHTVCAYPPELKGKELQKINVTNLAKNELPKPRLLKDLDAEIMALKGENVVLRCAARSSTGGNMSFQWKKDNVEVPSTSYTNHMESSADGKILDCNSELTLLGVKDTDAGKYQCVVSNAYGSTYSQKASISVLIFPAFNKTPANVTLQVGDVAKLECSAVGEPQPEIAWQKDGGNDFPAARERRMHVMPTDDVFFISNVKPSDMGVYSCTAHNAAGTVIANASLNVQQKPSFVRSMEDKEVQSGELVVLQCMAAGTPKPTIRWLKDSKAITETERHFFTAEDQLMIIVDTVQSDSGLYQCHLNNSLGDTTASCRLVVKPSALNTRDMLGILIIAVVCCAVVTSLIWVVIIYQTRLRRAPPAHAPDPLPITLPFGTDVDATSNHSSSRDSGTGDSAKRSSDDLATEEFALMVDRRFPVVAETHSPLLHYPRSTNHNRRDSGEEFPLPPPPSESD